MNKKTIGIITLGILLVIPVIIHSCGKEGGKPISSVPSATPVLWVTNVNDGTVSVMNRSNFSVGSPINVGTAPGHIAIIPALSKAFVGDLSDSKIHVLDTSSQTFSTSISVSSPIGGIDVDITNQKIYALDTESGGNPGKNLHIIDATNNNEILDNVIGQNVQDIRVDEARNKAYITDFVEGVILFDTTTSDRTGAIALADGPHGMAIDSSANLLYVTRVEANLLTIIDTSTNSIITSVTVGDTPQWVALNSDKSKAFVTNELSGTVSVVDTASRSVIDTITVGTSPFYIEIDTTNHRAYVTNAGSDNVTIFNTETHAFIDNITMGDQPIGMELQN